MRILVAADFTTTREHYVRMLKLLGIETILEAESAEQTVSVLKAGNVDLLLCEMSRGSRDLMTIGEFRSRGCEVPMILIADSVDRKVIVSAIQSGCSDYLLKPVTAAMLEEKLAKWAGACASFEALC